jgi:mRNA-degrading endonuclease RelE of RelBE toxin-antitoxin system
MGVRKVTSRQEWPGTVNSIHAEMDKIKDLIEGKKFKIDDFRLAYKFLNESKPENYQLTSIDDLILKLKEILKSIKTCFSFEEFWSMYDKKTGKGNAEKKYNNLTEKDRAKIKETLPLYLANIDDKKYQKDPCTYLNGRFWNDEIFEKSENQIKKIEAKRMCIFTSPISNRGQEIKGTYERYQMELNNCKEVKFIKFLDENGN